MSLLLIHLLLSILGCTKSKRDARPPDDVSSPGLSKDVVEERP
jgi:hypothetical protein